MRNSKLFSAEIILLIIIKKKPHINIFKRLDIIVDLPRTLQLLSGSNRIGWTIDKSLRIHNNSFLQFLFYHLLDRFMEIPEIKMHRYFLNIPTLSTLMELLCIRYIIFSSIILFMSTHKHSMTRESEFPIHLTTPLSWDKSPLIIRYQMS